MLFRSKESIVLPSTCIRYFSAYVFVFPSIPVLYFPAWQSFFMQHLRGIVYCHLANTCTAHCMYYLEQLCVLHRSLFFRHVHGVQRRDGGDRGGSHARGRRGPTSCRVGGWRDPLGCLQTPPFRLYNAFVQKTLNTRTTIHEKFRSRRRRQP